MDHAVTATAEWHPSTEPGQIAALLALLFAPEPAREPAATEDAA